MSNWLKRHFTHYKHHSRRALKIMRFFIFGFQNSLGDNKQGNALGQLWGTFIAYQEADINLRSDSV